MIGFEPELNSYEEALFRDDGIDGVFTGEWTINSIHMYEPIYIGPFGALSENGVNNV
jgi:hypothetical protein